MLAVAESDVAPTHVHSEATASASPNVPGRSTGRVPEIDVVRLLAFSAVIAVHAIAFTEQPSNRAWAGALMLLQFGREVFFALTGFVLVHAAVQRPSSKRDFWRRRFAYVAIPYLAWSAIYEVFHLLSTAHPHVSWGTIGADLATGNAEYHLYFLLVSMQLYLVFPWLLPFVRRTADRAAPVLAVVGVVNMAWLAALQYVAPPSGWPGFFWQRAYELLPTYSVYVLAGCYAALHYQAIRQFVVRRKRTLLLVAGAAAVLAEAAYVAQLGGRPPRVAASVLQPAMVFTCIAALVVVYLTGRRWVVHGQPHRRLVEVASDASFGVYLAHPLVLELLLRNGLGNDNQLVPSTVATVLAAVGCAAGALAVSLVARRTRLSLALTGRPRTATAPSHQLRRPFSDPSQARVQL